MDCWGRDSGRPIIAIEQVRYYGGLDESDCHGNGEKWTSEECDSEVEPSGLAGRLEMKI